MSHKNNDLTPINNDSLFSWPRDIFSSFMSNFLNDNFWDNFGIGNLKVDVREKPDAYIIDAEMPGLSKENVNIDIVDNVMTISAHVDEEKEQKDTEGRYLRRERRTGSIRRSFYLDRIKADEIKAEMKNGVLTIYCPKKEKSYPNLRRVQIN